MTLIKGIDISSYQKALDFSAAKSAGYKICIIKATESTIYTNGVFADQINKALNNGFQIGFYHFFRNNGLAEAKYFVNTIKPYATKMSIKPVIDIESTYTNEQVLAFINYVEDQLDVDCMVYCNLSYAKNLSKNSDIAKRPLWLAYYGNDDGTYHEAPNTHGFKTLAGQQYSSANTISGVNVDTNYFYDSVYITKSNTTPDNNSSTTRTTTTETIANQYSEKGTFYPNTTINFRNKPEVNDSTPIVGTYTKGEYVKYDKVVITNKHVWISWISATRSIRRYMPIRDITNGVYGSIWGTIK